MDALQEVLQRGKRESAGQPVNIHGANGKKENLKPKGPHEDKVSNTA